MIPHSLVAVSSLMRPFSGFVVDFPDRILDLGRDQTQEFFACDAVLFADPGSADKTTFEHPGHGALADLQVFPALFGRVEQIFFDIHLVFRFIGFVGFRVRFL